MPELPDVEIFKRVLDRHALGRVVARVEALDPGSLEGATADTLQRRLKGKRLSGTQRHGKVLFAEFQNSLTLAMHFGTNGSLQAVPSDAEEPPSTRLLIEFSDGARLAYVNPCRIGHVCVTDSAAAFYADEILFQARLNPGMTANTLDAGARRRLFNAMRHTLHTAIDCGAGAENFTDRLPKEFLLPERHAGGHCPRCGTALVVDRRGGRASYHCPRYRLSLLAAQERRRLCA
jgi:formamidopyrimidine-DNA glycosylase